jgi:hypothetical protein
MNNVNKGIYLYRDLINVTNCSFIDNIGDDIMCDGVTCDNLQIRNNRFTGGSQDGIHITSTSGGATGSIIAGNLFYNKLNDKQAIYLNNVENILIQNNTFANGTLSIASATGQRLINITISNNNAYNITDDTGTTGSYSFLHLNLITGLIFKDNVIQNVRSIYVSNSNDSVIQNNSYVDGFEKYGIYITNNCSVSDSTSSYSLVETASARNLTFFFGGAKNFTVNNTNNVSVFGLASPYNDVLNGSGVIIATNKTNYNKTLNSGDIIYIGRFNNLSCLPLQTCYAFYKYYDYGHDSAGNLATVSGILFDMNNTWIAIIIAVMFSVIIIFMIMSIYKNKR